MSADPFETPPLRLRYDTAKPWDEPDRRARWQIMRLDDARYWRVREDDVPIERAMEIAALFGVRDAALKAMREEAAALAASARKRLEQSAGMRRDAEAAAVAECRAARALRRTIGRVSA